MFLRYKLLTMGINVNSRNSWSTIQSQITSKYPIISYKVFNHIWAERDTKILLNNKIWFRLKNRYIFRLKVFSKVIYVHKANQTLIHRETISTNKTERILSNLHLYVITKEIKLRLVRNWRRIRELILLFRRWWVTKRILLRNRK